MVRLGMLALVGAGVLGYMTYTEGTLALRSSSQPDVSGLNELIARGADGNAHVIVTDFLLCDNLVNQSNNTNKDHWTDVWIPIVPKEHGRPPQGMPLTPRRVEALFYSNRIHNEQELNARLEQPRVQGLITNRIATLEPKIRNLLQGQYPDTDFDKCLIIQEGRTPWGAAGVVLLGAASLVCVLIAVGFFAGAALRKR